MYTSITPTCLLKRQGDISSSRGELEHLITQLDRLVVIGLLWPTALRLSFCDRTGIDTVLTLTQH